MIEHFRPPRRVLALCFVALCLPVLAVDALAGGIDDPVDALLRAAFLGAALTLVTKPATVDLMPTALVVKGARWRIVPFSQVEAVERVRRRGAERVVLQLTAERLVLPSPRHVPLLWPDRDLDAKAARIAAARVTAHDVVA